MTLRCTMVIFAVCLLPAQQTPVFRTEGSLALVPFHVVQKNHYKTDLKPEDVILLEDGAPRKFTVFENAMAGTRTVPVKMTLLFDTSGSVMGQGLLNPPAFKETLLDNLQGGDHLVRHAQHSEHHGGTGTHGVRGGVCTRDIGRAAPTRAGNPAA